MSNQEMIKEKLAEERTLLAAERTFSAWIRTALAAMAGGLAILRLAIFKTELHRLIAHTIGILLILWGCLVVILSSIDYKKMRDKFKIAKSYKTSQLGAVIIVVPLVIISILLIWLILP